MIGARRIDDDIGGLRRLRQALTIIKRSQQRLDAAGADCIGFFLERTRPVT
jgi:hypothetical protein